MNRTPLLAVVALAGTLALSGCTGDSGAGSGPTASSAVVGAQTLPGTPTAGATSGPGSATGSSGSPSARPAPTVTVSGKAAQTRYLTLAQDYNDAFFATTKEDKKSSPDLAVLTRESAKAAAALTEFVAELRATSWPADVQPYADALARSAEGDIPPWQASARATSVEQWRSIEFPAEDRSAAKMREALQLPPVPTS